MRYLSIVCICTQHLIQMLQRLGDKAACTLMHSTKAPKSDKP
jgi:hypothetical protein